MVKKVLMLFLLFALAACGAKHAQVKPVELKKEMPMWRLVMYKEAGSSEIKYVDKWYMYSLALDKVVMGPNNFKNRLYGECRYDGGTYTVMDKETGEVVREEQVVQKHCNSCHNR